MEPEATLLTSDKEIPGQKYTLLSFVSPETVLKNKDVYYFNQFLKSYEFEFKTKSIEEFLAKTVININSNLETKAVEFEKLDYKLNPSNGFIFKIDYGTGFKQIFRNPGLDSLDYNSITTWLPKQEFHLETWWFTRTFKRQVLVLGNRSFKLQQSEYFRNDLAQIGGARLLRGFNENQFFTNAYTVFSFEYRYLLDKNSHVLLFYDLSQIVLTEQGRRSVQTPKGVGVGINFETRAGILNLTFASGQIGQEAFNFARPRVHLGIVSQF
jgi:hemolysin activation/secretion protein